MQPPRLVMMLLAALASLAVVGSATGLAGQVIPSAYRFTTSRQEAGVLVGHLAGGGGIFGLGPLGGTIVSGRYGVEVSGPFGLEGTVSYLSSTRDVMDPRRPLSERKRGTADVSLLLIDARLRFSLTGRRTWHSLSPFIVAGGGMGFDVADRPEADDQLRENDRFRFGVKVTGLLGGGVRWMVSDRVLVRGDAHLTLWQLSTPDGYQDPGLDLGAAPQSEWVNSPTFTIGVAYRF